MKGKFIMKAKFNFRKTMVVALLAMTTMSAMAQVTVGSLSDPQQGALLEIKSKESTLAAGGVVTDKTNETVDENGGGGLLFPRVWLTDLTTMDPLIDSNGNDWTSNAGQLKEKHAGMVVYNIHEDKTNKLEQGLYVWDGAKWTPVLDGNSKERWFLLPSFNIELTSIANDVEVDLYEEYLKQYDFKHSKSTVEQPRSPIVASDANLISPTGYIYDRSELDFVVTYYDTQILDNVRFEGNYLKFDVTSLDLTANSFINIIAITK
jgi:hypothetical protein